MFNSENKTFTPKTYLNTIVYIHAAMLVGVLLFTIYIYITGEGFIVGFFDDKNVFVYLVPTIAMLSYFTSNYLFTKQLQGIKKLNSLRGKQLLYLKASMVRFAFLEGATIFSTIAYRLNNNIFYLVISLLLILYIFKLRPTKNRVISDLELNLEDQQYFQKNDKEIK